MKNTKQSKQARTTKRNGASRCVQRHGSACLLDFNVNDHVLVRLTKEGLAVHRKQYDDLNAAYGGKLPFKYRPPKTDLGGWSRWQMHDLMRTFGAAMPYTACPVPFATNIKIEVRSNDRDKRHGH